MSFKGIKVLLLLVVAVLLVTAPYSFSYAEKSNKVVDFYSKDPIAWDQLYSTDAKALEKANKFNKDNRLRVRTLTANLNDDILTDNTSLAYPAELVEQNTNLQKKLQKALLKGKKVYLYGDLSLKEYADALNTEIQMEIPSKEPAESFVVDLTDANDGTANKEKRLKVEAQRDFQVIGYSLNEGDALRLLLLNIDVADENGKKIKPSSMIYLQSILQHEANSIEKGDKLAALHTAVAGNTIVKSSSSEIVATAYYLTHTAGKIISQWLLYKNNDETDSTYDYFTLEDQVQITDVESQYNAKSAQIKHTLPFSADDVWDSDPDDKNDGPFQITIGYPWSISASYTIDTSPDVDLNEDLVSDIATWNITDDAMESEDKFMFDTAWKSTGTYAGIDVYHYAKWYTGFFDDISTDTSQSFQIRYDY